MAKKYHIDPSLYPEGTTEVPNPHFYFGSDEFELSNGDYYVGEYCAHKIGIVWREGQGVYTTKDNHTYEGIWENDQLLNSENSNIKYPDGIEYQGPLINTQYSGEGAYILQNKLPITANFEENIPLGEVTLTDPQKNLWKGEAEAEADFVILRPENQFYFNLSYERGKGKEITSKLSDSVSVKSSDSCVKDLKQIIFKKSSKTKNDFQETLFDENKEQVEKVKPKNKISLLKTKSGSNTTLLKTFLSSKFRNSCPPISVFSAHVKEPKKETG